jgi:uncharacterized heparinase superfamily protein
VRDKRRVGRIGRAFRYLRTARYLSFGQLLYWPLRRLQNGLPVRAPTETGAPNPIRLAQITSRVVAWGPGDSSSRVSRAGEICNGSFTMLNCSERLDEIEWNRRYGSRLWTYNLHYFDYAIDLAWGWRVTGEQRFADRFAELALSWIDQTRPGRGDGWDPYVISVRVVNWIYAVGLFGTALKADVCTRVWKSVSDQLSVLHRRVEYHLRANHLLRNYRALLIGGIVMNGSHANHWVARGRKGLWSEFVEQVLPDGGHFERSPMYHVLALSDFLEAYDICRATDVASPEGIEARLRSMVAAMGVLSRPNGDLHLFNDAANGVATPRAQMELFASSVLGKPLTSRSLDMRLPSTGYWGYVDGNSAERLLVDCGEPGPSYQPGHVHCDLLSFELDLAGQRVIVDSGTSGYAEDPLRDYQRSTAAHNTVTIGGTDQSELWGVFRVARRARVVLAKCSMDDDVWRFRGAYRPYHRRDALHERSVERGAPGEWRVTDRVEGAKTAPLQSFLHFHPDYTLSQRNGVIVADAASRPRVVVRPFGINTIGIARGESDPPMGWYSPEFGIALPSAVLTMTVARNDGREFGYAITAEIS